MIFDDINRADTSGAGSRRRRRHRSRRHQSEDESGPTRRRSSFERAAEFGHSGPDRGERSDRSVLAWLSMLAALVLVAGGFAFYLQHEKSGRTSLPGAAPSTLLLPFVDPILAPLETGNAGCDSEALDRVAAELQAARVEVNRDDGEIYSVAGTMASILKEALEDRLRHLQRLIDLGSPVIGLSEGGAPKNPATSEVQRQHLELAIGVSWQRNSVTYRNRVEELWYRLLRLEQGRFREGSASAAMVPPVAPTPSHE